MKIDKAFASELVSLAIKKGADSAEVYLTSARNLSVEVKNQETDAVESSLSSGYSLRVIKDKKLGFSYSTSSEEMKLVAGNAVESARWPDADEYLEIPHPSGNGKMHGTELRTSDSKITGIREEDAIRNVLMTEKAAKDYDSRIKKIRKASGTFHSGEVIILNSNGVDVSYPFTKCTAQVMTVAEENGEAQMGWDFEGSRFLDDISFEEVGRNAAKRAVQLLGSKKIATTKVPVILDSSVASEFLGVLASSLSAESIQKGRSLLKDKAGRKVISSKINIIDSGIIPARLGTKPFDDEGIITSEKAIIKDGVLQGYLHNTYTAKKDGIHSTGNAVRGGYAGLPSVGITNLYIQKAAGAGAVPFGNLISSISRGLYIIDAMGVHTANPISGEFSVGISGLWIENGEIQFAVKEAVLSGDILGFFDKTEETGDDLRFYGKIGAPNLLMGPTDISA